MQATGESRGRLLLEREDELADFNAALEAAGAGDGKLLVVQGPPGIGKTALVNDCGARARLRDFAVLTACGSIAERDYPFGIAQQFCGPPVSALSPSERSAALEASGPAAAALGLSGPLPARADASFAVVHGLHKLVLRLAADAPLLIAVDDAQWADVASLRFLNYLAGRLTDLPALLILATRPAGSDTNPLLARLLGLPALTVLEPPPLSADGAAAMLRDRVAVPVSERFAKAAHEATGGNPLLLHEVARAASAGLVDPYTTVDFDAASLPSLARSVRSRLASFPTGAAAICRAVAALGAVATIPRAARVAAISPNEAAPLLDGLVAADVLSSVPPYDFVHPLVRAAVIDDWPPGERAVMRRRAGQVLAEDGEMERAGLQMLDTSPAGDGWVIHVLRAGAAAALQRGGPDAAWRLLRRALDEPPSLAQRAEILREAATAGRLAGEVEALDLLREHIELLHEPEAVTAAEVELGWWFMWAGRPRETLDLLDRHLDASSSAADLVPEAIALASAHLVDPDSVSERARRLRQHAEVADEPAPSASWVLAALDAMAGNPVAATASAIAARQWLAAPSSPPPPNFVYLAFALVLSEQFSLAAEVFEAAASDARRAGAIPQFSLAATWAGWGAFGCGDLVAADAHASAALASGHLGVWGGISPAAVALLVEIRLVQGDVERAEGLLAEYRMLHAMPEEFIFARPRYTRGLVHVARGRLTEALIDFTESGKVASRHRCPTPGWVPWRSAAAAVLVRKGDRDAARRLADDELALARDARLPAATAAALRVCASAAPNDQAARLYREAVNAAAGGGARLAEALALFDLGAALRRRGHRVEAREPLSAALDLAARCRAAPLAEQAREELLATGARPRRVAVSGPDALTFSEQRVVALAASGRTNRQIADALVVSTKTVEKHLASAFRKLQITRREELASALARGV